MSRDLDQVATRQLAAYSGPERRRPAISVAERLPETEGNVSPRATETDGNSHSDALPVDVATAVSLALARVGLSHKEAALTMRLTPGQWSKQLHGVDGHHLSFPRLMRLGRPFRQALWQILGEADGLAITQHDIADITLLRVCDLMTSLGTLAVQFRALRRSA